MRMRTPMTRIHRNMKEEKMGGYELLFDVYHGRKEHREEKCAFSLQF